MKKIRLLLILIPFFAIISTGASAAKTNAVTEIYYHVTDDGQIEKNKIIEKRDLLYDLKWNFISGKSGSKTIDSDASRFYTFPTYRDKMQFSKYDNFQRVISFWEDIDEDTFIIHLIEYDQWGNISKHSSSYMGNPEKTSVTIYEYVYLDKFTYAWKYFRSYISGMLPNYKASWVLRTAIKDGKTVEHTERKTSKQ